MFNCKICEKVFQTRQSLGGHMSSHNRGDSFKVGRKKTISIPNHLCKYCGRIFNTGQQVGGHQVHCKLNPNHEKTKKKISLLHKGRVHSDEYKQKVSQGRIKYLKENPDKHPWKKNTKFVSEPCERFKTFLKNSGFIFEEEFNPIPNRFFSVDIAFPNTKICIEINGEQHYNRDGSLKKYYKNRHDIIKNNGWTIIEIHYLKVYDRNYINNIIKLLS